jgi:[protein-PII] uridylyltransferase
MSAASLAPGVREFYTTQSEHIRQRFHANWDGVAVVRARSALVDEVGLQLYRSFISPHRTGPEGFCLAAIGGFGRRALFPHSDVDILFLCQDAPTERVHRDAVAQLCREMWDLRLRLSPTTRTLAECNQLHRDNLEFNISLLDCRYLAGDQGLLTRLRDQAIPQLVAREFQALTHNLAELARRRHTKYGHTIFHLEPNVKESPGGLRDYNLACWLTLISELESRRAWPASEDLLPPARRKQIHCAFEFLAAVRCFLHYHLGRDDNVLSYEHQAEAASAGVGSVNGGIDPADWMRTYFRHARSISGLTVERLDEVSSARSSLYRTYQQWRSRLSNREFMVSRGRIFVRQPAELETPGAILRLFELSARHGLGLSPDTERRVAGALPSVRRQVPGFGLWASLREILRLPHAADALRSMHRLGVLTLLFPEFQCIDALVVRDYYHRYTVDEHSFMCIENVHNLRRPDGDLQRRFGEILAATEQPELLFLALLFHDVGKGMAADSHVQGSLQALDGILQRMALNPDTCHSVRFLVANHLEMSLTLARRDIFDPETIRAFAETVGTFERLKMLCLMTYADIKAVNPDALTPWRAEMLWQLYAATTNYLTHSIDHQRLMAEPVGVSESMGSLPGAAPPHELAGFLSGLPKRYLLSHSQQEIAQHCNMARNLDGGQIQLRLEKRSHAYMLTVVTTDRSFLFATIAGTLAAWGMNIVKAEAFCNQAAIVVDCFHFTDSFHSFDLNPSEMERFKRRLSDVICGELSLRSLLEGRLRAGAVRPIKVTVPTQVSFDNTCSSHSTLLELITQDRPGLLYQVASTLSELGCNIEVALIDTEGQRAVDVFYVTANGAKLDHQQQGELRQALLEELCANP